MTIRYCITIAALVGSLAGSAAAQPDPTDLDADGLSGVSEPVAGAEAPEVFALQGTGSILIDRSHLESFNVNGFMSFLISQGWTVAENQDYPITEAILAPYDVVMVPTATTFLFPFSTEEVAAFNAYLAAGGGLWIFHESFKDATGANSLASSFGVTFQFDGVIDSTNNEGAAFWPTISNLSAHSISAGVTSYGYYGGCCLNVVSPSQVIASGDADAYSDYCPTAPAVLSATVSGARVICAGDITPLHPNYYPSQLRDEEELLLQNVINWLAGFLPTTTSTTSWGGIKALYR